MQRTLAVLMLAAALGCASTGTPVERGQWVSGASALYEIQATGFSWQRMPADSEDRHKADLALRDSPGSALYVYLYERSARSVEELVNIRRKSVQAGLVVQSRIERREFLDGADLVPVVWVQYEVGDGALGHAFYSTAIVDTGAKLIEIVAYNNGTGKGPLGNARLERVVRSIRLVPPVQAAPVAVSAPRSDPT